MMWNLQSYQTKVLNERIWHLWGVKTYSDHPTCFQGPVPQLTTTLLCRQCHSNQAVHIVDHQYSTLDCIVLAQLTPVPYVVIYVFKHRSYIGKNNNIIHTVQAPSVTYWKGRLTGGWAFDRRGEFYPGLLIGVAKKKASDRGVGNWPGAGAFDRTPFDWSVQSDRLRCATYFGVYETTSLPKKYTYTI